ncbi:MAG: tRNA(Ile)-lysidine synthase [Paraglaciecola sp.]|jgi:tRNA(Ile)-lysidine synthase
MKTAFLAYISDNQLIDSNKRTLLAVSGGIDSVVLCHLFKEINLSFGIAHCNFKLRKKASDEDDFFVKKLAQDLAVPFFSIPFETEQIATERKQSIQVVARDLRYEWLERVRIENAFDCIATAHHLNDSVETVFYNFTKGCGIRGLHGILPKAGKIIRPLLFITKEELKIFAKKEGINWREDASNSTDKYARNKIRHHVIPVLKELNPNFEKTAGDNILRLRETEALYDFAIQNIKKDIVKIDVKIDVKNNGDTLSISIPKLRDSPAPLSVLFEILKPYHFNNQQVKQILQATDFSKKDIISGKMFYANDYCLLIDRDFLILKKEEITDIEHVLIFEKDTQIQLPNRILKIKKIEKPTQFLINNQVAILDFEKLNFPLKIRKWQAGDTFCPLGMKGKRQKLQDFFSNNKFTKFDKEATWLLENRGEIVWIVGHRIDERYKMTNQTNSCLQLEVV